MAAAKRIREAMHVSSGGADGGGLGGSVVSGTSATDDLFGQVLADGHEEARKQP